MSIKLSQDLGIVVASAEPEFIRERDLAVGSAEFVEAIESQDELDMAIDIVRRMKKIAKETESTRKELGAPVADLKKRIDAVAAEFVAPLQRQIERLERLATIFVTAREEEKRKKEAAEKAERERLAAEQREAEAKLARERIAKEAPAKTEKERQVIAANFQAEQQKLEDIHATKQAELIPSVPAGPKPAAKGFANRHPWRYEVLDPAELYKSRPDLCNIVPKGREILEAAAKGETIPGVRTWQDTEVSVRIS